MKNEFNAVHQVYWNCSGQHNKAYERLYSVLDGIAGGVKRSLASNYKAFASISSCRSNAACLVSGRFDGDRSAFLNEIDTGRMNEFVFLDTMDATFINASSEHPCESFGAAFVASMHQHVLDSNPYGLKEQDGYFMALKEVGDGFEGVQSMSTSTGIDAIYNGCNVTGLEQRLHEYFKMCSQEVFGGKLICCRIDNIDMLFSNGYQMLEAIRKYLSSPFVAVVATGDLNSHWTMELGESCPGGCDGYLNKVFPVQCRISLEEERR